MDSAPPAEQALQPAGTSEYSARQVGRTRLLAQVTGCPATELLGDTEDASLAPQALIEVADELELVAATLVAMLSDLQGSDPVQVLQIAFLIMDQPYPENG